MVCSFALIGTRLCVSQLSYVLVTNNPPSLHGLLHHRFLFTQVTWPSPAIGNSAWHPCSSGTPACREAPMWDIAGLRAEKNLVEHSDSLNCSEVRIDMYHVSSHRISLAKAKGTTRLDVSGVGNTLPTFPHLLPTSHPAVGVGTVTVWTLQFTTWGDEHCSTPPPIYVFVPQDKFLEVELLSSEYAHLLSFCYSLCLLGFNCCRKSAVNL